MRYKTRSYTTDLNCGCMIFMVIFNITVGGLSVNYLLEVFLNKTIPFWGAALLGLFVGEVSVPVAIVVWLLKFFAVL